MSLIASNIRAVFFDAVGTLIHPNPPAVAVYADAARRHGSRLDAKEIAGRFRSAFQREEALDAANGHRTDEPRELRRWQAIVAAVLDDVRDSAACFRELYDHFAKPASWSCAPGTADVLQELARRGYVLGLASNFDQRLRAIAAGLLPLKPIQHCVISSEVGWKKPAFQFFAAICQAVALAPNQILLVGDDLANDVLGAKAAGMEALLFDSSQRRDRDARRISELTELLDDEP